MSAESPKKPENSAQEDYLQILSHQLKAPISTIQFILNAITEGFTGETNPKTLQFIEKAVNRITEAKAIISDLFDYELYAQNQVTAREELEMVVLLSELVNRYASRAAEKNIALHAELLRTHKIFLRGDRRGLEQALRNIIENALKYTPEQGRVTVAMGISEAEKRCQITVTDTGYGIPEHELANIFEPFYRSLKHKASIPGTGLGLPIAKRVITSHQGTITVTSQEQVGTTFSLLLPYTRVEISAEPVTQRKKVIIIGGVTAGAKTAARLRRLDEALELTILEKSEFLSYSGCSLPLYITDRLHASKALMSTADNTIRDVNFFEAIENITALNHTVALAIDRENKTVTAQDLVKHTIAVLPYDVLVLATGTEFLPPPIPGLDQPGVYPLHSLEEADALKREFLRREAPDIYIIGGGLIGTATAEALITPGGRVVMLEKKPSILFDQLDGEIAFKIQHELHKKGVKIVTNVDITRIEKSKTQLVIQTLQDTYQADLIILATGVKPNVALAAKAGLTIGEAGGIRVTPSMQTSDEHIYAVGDCAESINLLTQKHEYWPLGSVSTKMGRIAADNICGRNTEFHGSLGTMLLKIGEINVARTGLTLRRARAHGFEAEAVIVAGLDRAHYYDNAKYVILKVIADRNSKVILGAQGYGKGEVVAKIQMLAFAITHALTLEDVFNVDLGYTPAFNTPVDLVQTACLVLNNKIEKLFRTIPVEDFEAEKTQAAGIIDVSPFSEHVFHFIPGSINIPLENIRLEGIPFEKNAKVILYSKTSSGAYKAYRYLTSRGYANLWVLEGGYICWER